MKVIVNGSVVELEGDSISYEDIVRIAFNERVVGHPTVTFHGPGASGTLTPGHSAQPADGFVFNVVAADAKQ